MVTKAGKRIEYEVEELEEMMDAGVAATNCPEGCEVEPDGECEHGYPSVLIEAGVI